MDEQGSVTLLVIEEAAKVPCALFFIYDKGTGEPPKERLVEPSGFKEAADGGVLLRAYQLEPEVGWRFFSLQKILAARARPDVPMNRPPQGILSGEIVQAKRTAAAEEQTPGPRGRGRPMSPANGYRKLLEDTMADMSVTLGESANAANYRQEHGISPEAMRAVHYGIFLDFLKDILRDKLVTEEERAFGVKLNDCLRKCGAGILE